LQRRELTIIANPIWNEQVLRPTPGRRVNTFNRQRG